MLFRSGWLVRARAQLYHSVYLASPTDYTLFSRTISTSTNLAALVKRIDCGLSGEEGWDGPEYNSQSSGAIHIPMPIYIVVHLVNLREAAFSTGYGIAPVAFLGFITGFAICPKLELLTLHDIQFEHWNHIFGTVWAFPFLQSLQLKQCWMPSMSMYQLFDSNYPCGRCPQLTQLDVSYVSQQQSS